MDDGAISMGAENSFVFTYSNFGLESQRRKSLENMVNTIMMSHGDNIEIIYPPVTL